jgi:hypothetical protein
MYSVIWIKMNTKPKYDYCLPLVIPDNVKLESHLRLLFESIVLFLRGIITSENHKISMDKVFQYLTTNLTNYFTYKYQLLQAFNA